MPPKKKYTDPKLRDEVKEEVQEGDKGGAPGQWSARKVCHVTPCREASNYELNNCTGSIHGFRV